MDHSGRGEGQSYFYYSNKERKEMEIKILQEKLAKALNHVSKVVAGGRATLPILNNVLIRVDDKKVSITDK